MSRTSAETILEQYCNGKRIFQNEDVEEGSFENQNLEGISFEDCSLYISFRNANLKNARFVNGGVKTCDFKEADLTNAHFENVCIESVKFKGAKTNEIFFDNNSCYGQRVSQKDFDDWIKDVE